MSIQNANKRETAVSFSILCDENDLFTATQEQQGSLPALNMGMIYIKNLTKRIVWHAIWNAMLLAMLSAMLLNSVYNNPEWYVTIVVNFMLILPMNVGKKKKN